MPANLLTKPKWFQRSTIPGEFLVGKDVVRIEDGDAIDHSMNSGSSSNRNSYHISHTGEVQSGKNLKAEMGDANEHNTNNSGGNPRKIYHLQRHGEIVEEGYEHSTGIKKPHTPRGRMKSSSSDIDSYRMDKCGCHIPEISAFGLLTSENDCLDATFDSLESYACKERTSDVIRPKDGKTNNSISTMLHATDSELGLSQSNDESSSTSDYREIYESQQQHQQLKAYSDRIDRENSLLDAESANNVKESKSRHLSLENCEEDHLKQLRESKRVIESERIRLGQSQTIVIPRSSLYGIDDQNVKQSESYAQISKLQVGSSVTNKQVRIFDFQQKLALAGTILLILIGVVIMIVALFFPARILR